MVRLPQEKELTKQELAALTTEELKQELLAAHRGWHAPIETFLAHTPAITKTNLYDLGHLPTWHTARVILIGDAAHAMSPSAGQGASIALEDVMCLAKGLARPAPRLEEVFARFERKRRSRAERIAAQARLNESRQRQQLGPLGCWFRNRMLSVVLPLFGERGLDWMYRYRFAWEQ